MSRGVRWLCPPPRPVSRTPRWGLPHPRWTGGMEGWPHLPLRLRGEGGCDCSNPGVVTGRGVPCLPAALCPKQLPVVVPNRPILPPPRSRLMGWHPDGTGPYPWPSPPLISQRRVLLPPSAPSPACEHPPRAELRAGAAPRAPSLRASARHRAPGWSSAWGCLLGGCSRGWCCPELSTGGVITEPGAGSVQRAASSQPGYLQLCSLCFPSSCRPWRAASRHRDFLLNNTSPSGACLSRKLHHYTSNWLRKPGFVKALQNLTGTALFWPSRCWQNIRLSLFGTICSCAGARFSWWVRCHRVVSWYGGKA